MKHAPRKAVHMPSNTRTAWQTHQSQHHPVLQQLPVLLTKMLHNGTAGKVNATGITLGAPNPECAAVAHRLLRGKRTARR